MNNRTLLNTTNATLSELLLKWLINASINLTIIFGVNGEKACMNNAAACDSNILFQPLQLLFPNQRHLQVATLGARGYDGGTITATNAYERQQPVNPAVGCLGSNKNMPTLIGLGGASPPGTIPQSSGGGIGLMPLAPVIPSQVPQPGLFSGLNPIQPSTYGGAVSAPLYNPKPIGGGKISGLEGSYGIGRQSLSGYGAARQNDLEPGFEGLEQKNVGYGAQSIVSGYNQVKKQQPHDDAFTHRYGANDLTTGSYGGGSRSIGGIYDNSISGILTSQFGGESGVDERRLCCCNSVVGGNSVGAGVYGAATGGNVGCGGVAGRFGKIGGMRDYGGISNGVGYGGRKISGGSYASVRGGYGRISTADGRSNGGYGGIRRKSASGIGRILEDDALTHSGNTNHLLLGGALEQKMREGGFPTALDIGGESIERSNDKNEYNGKSAQQNMQKSGYNFSEKTVEGANISEERNEITKSIIRAIPETQKENNERSTSAHDSRSDNDQGSRRTNQSTTDGKEVVLLGTKMDDQSIMNERERLEKLKGTLFGVYSQLEL